MNPGLHLEIAQGHKKGNWDLFGILFEPWDIGIRKKYIFSLTSYVTALYYNKNVV